MIPDWAAHLVLAVAAAVAGALNVVAGGGSFLVLPLMIFLGLPATVANGTNRIGILAQNATAVWGFHQHRLIQGGWIAAAVVPALGGAALLGAVGAVLALPGAAMAQAIASEWGTRHAVVESKLTAVQPKRERSEQQRRFPPAARLRRATRGQQLGCVWTLQPPQPSSTSSPFFFTSLNFISHLLFSHLILLIFN